MLILDPSRFLHKALFKKKCIGAVAGVSASTHVLTNMNGSNCPNGYAGWFFEYGASIGPVGGSGEVGIGGSGDQINGGGGSIGVGIPIQAMLCYYTLVDDEVTPDGCCKK